MAVRLPSHERYVPQIDKEHRWLPILAPQLPLPIPRPIAKGTPGCGFPAPWSIYRWLPGEPAGVTSVTDYDRLAEDLGQFLTALQRVNAAGGPPAGAHSFNRGGPVAAWDEQTWAAIAELGDEVDGEGAMAVWEAALAAEWNGPDVWVHGDATGSNPPFPIDGSSRRRHLGAGTRLGSVEGADRYPGAASGRSRTNRTSRRSVSTRRVCFAPAAPLGGYSQCLVT
jgi:hypothetical protein